MCLYPRLIQNPKYKENGKNGGNIPPVIDTRVLYVPIACGKCMECKKQKSRQWQTRLLEDIKTNTNAKFISFTFSNESIKELTDQKPTKNWLSLKGLEGYELDNELATRATRLFLERWRKQYKKSIRHWLVTELGHKGTENIHLHGLIWTNETNKIITDIWQYGFTWIGEYVNECTINYIIKYINKIDPKHKEYNPKILTSKGIGNNYINTYNSKINKYNNNNTKETYTTRTGYQITLPIYWRNKIYTEHERELLWLNKLDKETRYIMGKKIDISKDDTQYKEWLKHYQKINREMGYGNHSTDIDKKQYEHDRRKLMQETRIKNKKNKPDTIKAPGPIKSGILGAK